MREPNTRFDLALECGNMDVAFEMANLIDREGCWLRLASAAMSQGKIQVWWWRKQIYIYKVVEQAYQHVKSFDSLSFLYFITGNRDKLSKMLKIAELRGDTMSRFNNALFLGDASEMVQILTQANQSLWQSSFDG